jgi:hypothetical protein
MHLTPQIMTGHKYDEANRLSKLERIRGNSKVYLKDLSLCLSSNPKFIIGITTIFSRGNYGYQRLDTLPQIFSYINSDCSMLPEIQLNIWTVSDIVLFSVETTIINKVIFTLNSDFTQQYILDFKNTPSPFRSFQDFWNFVLEIDSK